MFAGTSTGGLVALSLTAPDPDNPERPAVSADQLAALLHGGRPGDLPPEPVAEAPHPLGLARPQVHPRAAPEVDREPARQRPSIQNALRELIVTSYDMTNRDPYFFKRWRAREATGERPQPPDRRRRARHLGRPHLLPLARGRRARAGRWRRLRREPGDRRDRRGPEALRRRPAPPRPGRSAGGLDRHRAARGRLQPGAGASAGASSAGSCPSKASRRSSARRWAGPRTAPTTGPTRSSTIPTTHTSAPPRSATGRATSACRSRSRESVPLDDASQQTLTETLPAFAEQMIRTNEAEIAEIVERLLAFEPLPYDPAPASG